MTTRSITSREIAQHLIAVARAEGVPEHEIESYWTDARIMAKQDDVLAVDDADLGADEPQKIRDRIMMLVA